jgi:hypothetical protein
MDFKEKGWGGMDWIHLAQDRDLWRYLVNMAMHLRVRRNFEKLLSTERLAACQEALSSMGLVYTYTSVNYKFLYNKIHLSYFEVGSKQSPC